jgi:hypothetical protein
VFLVEQRVLVVEQRVASTLADLELFILSYTFHLASACKSPLSLTGHRALLLLDKEINLFIQLPGSGKPAWYFLSSRGWGLLPWLISDLELHIISLSSTLLVCVNRSTLSPVPLLFTRCLLSQCSRFSPVSARPTPPLLLFRFTIRASTFPGV